MTPQFVYSISFPIFGLYALFVTIQTLRANLRDAYSVPSVDEAQKAARNTVAEIAEAIRDALRDPQTTRQELVDFLEISGKKTAGKHQYGDGGLSEIRRAKRAVGRLPLPVRWQNWRPALTEQLGPPAARRTKVCPCRKSFRKRCTAWKKIR